MKLKTISRVVYYLCIWSTQPWTEKHECREFRSEKKQGYASFNVWEMSALPWTSLLLFRWNKQGNKCVLLRWAAFWEPRKCILILMPLWNALLQGIHFLEEVLMFSYRSTGIVKTNKNLADQLPELTKKMAGCFDCFFREQSLVQYTFLAVGLWIHCCHEYVSYNIIIRRYKSGVW